MRSPGEKQEQLALESAGQTEIGTTRAHNEDALYRDEDSGLFIVADGMGGRQAGETASKAVVTVLPGLLSDALRPLERATRTSIKAALVEALVRLSGELHRQSQAIAELAGLGSTAVVLLVRGDVGYVVHAGDSRAYLLRGGRLQQLTRDQTTADELARAGHLAPEEAARHPLRHSLEQFVGMKGRLGPAVLSRRLEHGDRWLLCSDGLTKGLAKRELRALLAMDASAERACRRLITAANEADGSDNITAVVVDVAQPGRAR